MQAFFGAASDIGRRRPQNEDSYIADAELGLYLVADGMGGHAAGEVASRLVADTVREFIVETQDDRDKTWPCPIDPDLSYAANRLRAAILVANRVLSQRSQEDESLRGMATTLSAILLTDAHAVVSNVGDCRAYLVRNKALSQVTMDHSWVAEQVRAGLLTKDAARAHPWRSMVTRALSGAAELDVDVIEMNLNAGDQLLLCSDGLYGLLSDDEISRLIAKGNGDPNATCQALIEAANARGGPDNITVLFIRLD